MLVRLKKNFVEPLLTRCDGAKGGYFSHLGVSWAGAAFRRRKHRYLHVGTLYILLTPFKLPNFRGSRTGKGDERMGAPDSSAHMRITVLIEFS